MIEERPIGDDDDETIAIAWSGDPADPPRVVVSGRGVMSDAILDVLEDEDIPVIHAPDLVLGLRSLDPGDPVPEEMFAAIDVLVRWINRLVARDEVTRIPGWQQDE